jgi:hypothetical protein
MGRNTVAVTTIIIGLETAWEKPLLAISGDSMAQASRLPTASHPPEAAAASMNERFDGFCCRAKMRPPIEGASSLAAMRARGGAAARRLGGGGRRLVSASILPPAGAADATAASLTSLAGLGAAAGRSALPFGRGVSGATAAAVFLPAEGCGTVLNFGRVFAALSGIGAAPASLGFGASFTGNRGFRLGPGVPGRSGARSPLPASGERAAVPRWVLPS